MRLMGLHYCQIPEGGREGGSKHRKEGSASTSAQLCKGPEQ